MTSDTIIHLDMLIQPPFPEQGTMSEVGKDNEMVVSHILRLNQVWPSEQQGNKGGAQLQQ